MTLTLDSMKIRKAVVLYLSQRIGANNFVDLQRECLSRDPGQTGTLPSMELFNCLTKSNMNVMEREFEELLNELDP